MDILKALHDKKIKTHIVYKANLNFNRAKQYLNELHGYGLVKITSNSPSCWAVTDQGYEFLKAFENLMNLCKKQGSTNPDQSKPYEEPD